MDIEHAAEIVRAARARGLTVVEIARRLRVHKNTVHNWLAGKGSRVFDMTAHNLRLLDKVNERCNGREP